MKKYLLFLVSVIILTSCKPQAMTPAKAAKEAQEQEKNIEKIKLPNFTFYPDIVTPEFGVDVTLSGMGNAYLTISQKHIYGEMPYLGHFYSAPMDRYDVPVQFTSDKFIYTVIYDEATSIFNITISPQDVQNLVNDNMIITMKLKKDGSGTAIIKTDERDEISYQGHYR